MKRAKLFVQIGIALLLAFAVMNIRGLFEAKDTAALVMAVSDGCTVTGVLYLGMGAIMWVSTTGFFDIFGYAVKRGLHAILPGMVQPDDEARFYEYKVKREGKRGRFTQHLSLIIGLVLLILGTITTGLWYLIADVSS